MPDDAPTPDLPPTSVDEVIHPDLVEPGPGVEASDEAGSEEPTEFVSSRPRSCGSAR